MLTVWFRHETPIFLQEKGREVELLVVMKKFYSGNEIRARLDALQSSGKIEGNSEAQEVTIYESFFDPRIRTASWVGFTMVTI